MVRPDRFELPTLWFVDNMPHGKILILKRYFLAFGPKIWPFWRVLNNVLNHA
jgi:hypothetical protein